MQRQLEFREEVEDKYGRYTVCWLPEDRQFGLKHSNGWIQKVVDWNAYARLTQVP